MNQVITDPCVPDASELNPGLFLGKGNTATVKLRYLPTDLADAGGSEKLLALDSASWTVKVYDGSTLIIYGSDKEQVWSLAPTRQVTVEGYDVGLARLDLSYYRAPNTMGEADQINVTVVEADVDVAGVADEVEESPGGFIALNDDDDDADGVIDYDDGYNKDGIPGNADDENPSEDDLTDICFELSPSWLTAGSVTLSQTGSDKVALWYGMDRLTLPITWDLSDPQERADFEDFCSDSWASLVYVEGIAVSTSPRDVEFKLSFASGGTVVHEDTVKLTVVDVDLTAADLFGQVTEQYEEYPDGAFIHFNLDNDDNSDNTREAPKRPGADYAQTGTTPVAGENDLELVLPCLTPLLSEGVVTLTNTSQGKLWKSATKGSGNFVLGYGSLSWNLADTDQRSQFQQLCTNPLYMEGASSTGGTVSLLYYSPTAPLVDCDEVYYHFIAADCGNQPTTTGSPSQRSALEGAFPSLVRCEWSITVGPSPYYNCIAWSAGLTDRWVEQTIYEPGIGFVPDKWENGVYKVSIDKMYGDGNDIFVMADLDAFYATEAGVSPTATGPEDATVMYYDGYHGARKMNCACGSGKWIMYESKCGEGEQLEHRHDQLDNSTIGYGARTRYYK
jgi:hypothetical protein